MQKFEQVQKQARKRTDEEVLGTFPEDYAPQAHGGDSDPADELIARIDQLLRALGSATGIEAA